MLLYKLSVYSLLRVHMLCKNRSKPACISRGYRFSAMPKRRFAIFVSSALRSRHCDKVQQSSAFSLTITWNAMTHAPLRSVAHPSTRSGPRYFVAFSRARLHYAASLLARAVRKPANKSQLLPSDMMGCIMPAWRLMRVPVSDVNRDVLFVSAIQSTIQTIDHTDTLPLTFEYVIYESVVHNRKN